MYESSESISNSTPSRVACFIESTTFQDRWQDFKKRVGPEAREDNKSLLAFLEDINSKNTDVPSKSLKVGPIVKKFYFMGPKGYESNFPGQ